MGAFCHRWYSFRRVGQGVFDRETTRDSLDLGQIGQVRFTGVEPSSNLLRDKIGRYPTSGPVELS
jgi:hypothetical protein